jgi:fructokinase
MKKIVAIGEVLFDVFPDKEVIGGAPFNYTAHIGSICKCFSLPFEVAMFTKIGNDENGKKVISSFEKYGISKHLLQTTNTHPTGLVNLSLDSLGVPDYEIVEHSAYDYLDYTPQVSQYLSENVEMLYFGTLAQRTNHNKKTYNKCFSLDHFTAEKAFFDINLRQNYYSWELIDAGFVNGNFLKINEDELQFVHSKFFKNKKLEDTDEFIEFLFNEYLFEAIILTKGDKGAEILINKGESIENKGVKVNNLVDTVGAGDAFSAMFTLGHLQGWQMEHILNRSVFFSSEVCKIKGALPDSVEWYSQFSGWF